MIVHQAFMEGKFVVKQTPGCFNGVGADMALEQIINRSQNSPSGINESSKKKQYLAFVCFWCIFSCSF